MLVIQPSNGTIFKNDSASTTLTARLYQGGTELDTTGSYTYRWTRKLKDGTADTAFSATGKSITVSAADVDDRSMYQVSVTF